MVRPELDRQRLSSEARAWLVGGSVLAGLATVALTIGLVTAVEDGALIVHVET